jgi:hypothetical protein
LIIVLLLALGLVMGLVMNMIVGMETGTVAVALLVPLLAYLLLSGTVAEFGFGGVNARFNRAAFAVMTLPGAGTIMPSSGDFDQVREEGSAGLEQMLVDKKLAGETIASPGGCHRRNHLRISEVLVISKAKSGERQNE